MASLFSGRVDSSNITSLLSSDAVEHWFHFCHSNSKIQACRSRADCTFKLKPRFHAGVWVWRRIAYYYSTSFIFKGSVVSQVPRLEPAITHRWRQLIAHHMLANLAINEPYQFREYTSERKKQTVKKLRKSPWWVRFWILTWIRLLPSLCLLVEKWNKSNMESSQTGKSEENVLCSTLDCDLTTHSSTTWDLAQTFEYLKNSTFWIV